MKKIILFLLLSSMLLKAEPLLEFLHPGKTNYILFFYTTWCPACKKSVEILNELNKENLDSLEILGINLDDDIDRNNFLKDTKIDFQTISMNREDTKKYGVYESIPVIYILNQKKQIIKKYLQTPRKKTFITLVERLQKGYLANGTLPIEKRVDLWKMDRRE